MTIVDVFATSAPLFISTVFVLSLLIGSFLNVVIHRVPIMLDREWRAQAAEMLDTEAGRESRVAGSRTPPEAALPKAQSPKPKASSELLPPAPSLQLPASTKYNLVVPRSACPHCGAAIGALQNIPVISYLVLRGKCANCRAPISARYPLVELGTAILSALVAWKFGFTPFTAGALLLTWILIALAAIDIDHQILPDNLTLPLMWLGLLISLGTADTNPWTLPVSAHESIIGAAAGYLILWLVYQLFKLVTGKEGMGYGDFKLLAALGAWLGWMMLPVVILLSAVTGAAIGILMIALRGRDRNIPIPFGPYLAAAGWIALMWGSEIAQAYLGRLQ